MNNTLFVAIYRILNFLLIIWNNYPNKYPTNFIFVLAKKFKQATYFEKNIQENNHADNKESIHENVNQENDKQSSFWSKCNFELVEKEQIMAALMMILSSVKEKIARKLWV